MRQILIEKGSELFYKEGFAWSSIRDIGRVAKVTTATLYHYFKNKDELLYDIIITIGDDLLKILNQTVREFTDPEERLRQMLYRQICLLKEKRESVRIYIEEQYQLPSRLKKLVYKQHRRIYDIYLNELGRLHKDGRLRIDHLLMANFAMFALMNWVYGWHKDDKRLSIEEIADRIITIVFNGFLLLRKRKRGGDKGRENR